MRTILVFVILLRACSVLGQVPPIEWKKCLGGTGYEDVRDIEQTSDGGYVVAVVTQSTDGDVTGNHGNADMWIIKLTALGAIEWQRALGGTGVELVDDVAETSDGGDPGRGLYGFR